LLAVPNLFSWIYSLFFTLLEFKCELYGYYIFFVPGATITLVVVLILGILQCHTHIIPKANTDRC